MRGGCHLVGFAARTAVGRSAQAAAAAVRAGISRIEQHPRWVDLRGEPIRGAFDHDFGDDMPCPERMLEMASAVLGDLSRITELSCPILLALPEARPGFGEDDARDLERRLRANPALRKGATVRTVARGHAGGLLALRLATEHLTGDDDGRCIVVGVDSYFDRRTLTWLAHNRQLSGPGIRSGFFPGEGACAVLVAAQHARRSLGWPSLATVRSVGVAREQRLIKTDTDNLGEGLTEAVTAAVRTSGEGPIDSVYCDINGERYRTEEWGFTILRTAQWFRDPAGYVSASACWGDLGAASGPAAAMLACAAWGRGYAPGPRALVFGGSEAGLRACAVLERTAGPNPNPKRRALH